MNTKLISKAIHINPDALDKILSTSETLVLIDFWAPWCAPCRMLGPVLDEIAEEYAGKVLVTKVNVDDYPELAQHYQVRGVPTVKVFLKGKFLEEAVGAYPKQHWESLIQKYSP